MHFSGDSIMSIAYLPLADVSVWRRKASLCFLALICLLVCGISALALLAVFVNWTDEELAPQANCFLSLSDTFQAADPGNSFYILKALDAGAGEDSMQAGMRQVAAEDVLYRKNPAAFFGGGSDVVYRTGDVAGAGIPSCNEDQLSCIPFYLHYREDWQRWRQSRPLLAGRFDQMLALGHYSEQLSPAFIVHSLQVRLLTEALHHSLLQTLFQVADGQTAAGLERMQLQDQWLRRVLANSRSVEIRETAISALFSQMRLLNDMLDAYPVLTQQHQQILIHLVRPLEPPEKNLVPVFEAEAHRILTNMRLNPAYWESLLPEKRSMLRQLVFQATLQPQATMNRLATYWSEQVQEVALPAAALIAGRRAGKKTERLNLWNEARAYLMDIYNLAGQRIAMRYETDPAGRMTNSLTDIDSYLHLAGLKLMLIVEKIPDSQILGTVAQAELRYRNAADNSAMQWNPRDRTLSFHALQAAGDTAGKSPVSVRIPLFHYAQPAVANP